MGYNRIPTKKDIIDMLCMNFGVSELVKVDEFESTNTRHICNGIPEINILPVMTYTITVPTKMGDVGIVSPRYVFCPRCRKMILDRNSIEVL